MADVVRDKFKKMNEKIKDLLDNYDKLKYPEIRKRISEITSLKFSLMDDLPDVFSISFGYWYVYLSGIDRFLESANHETYSTWTNDDHVKAWINFAKEDKEQLEKRLAEVTKNKK